MGQVNGPVANGLRGTEVAALGEMKDQRQHDEEEAIPGESSGAASLAVDVAAGALAGAALGMLAGPPGAALGAILGGAAGGLAEIAIERGEQEKREHEAELDRDIGVIGGDIGEPSLEHPAPTHGLYHTATLGVGSGDAEDSDGPIQNVDGT